MLDLINWLFPILLTCYIKLIWADVAIYRDIRSLRIERECGAPACEPADIWRLRLLAATLAQVSYLELGFRLFTPIDYFAISFFVLSYGYLPLAK